MSGAPRNPQTTATVSGPAGDIPDSLAVEVVGGPDAGAVAPLVPGSLVVGKEPGCDLVLTDPAVSRRHLEIAVTHDRIEVRDLGSKNGSFYLGARFDVIQVGPGSQIQIGTTQLAIVTAAERAMPLHPETRFGRLLGQTPAMRRVFAALARLARLDVGILITGETGTGKDLAAQAVHAASPRASKPFVVCDLGAIPASLIEAELFGAVRGAYTGADRDRPGVFEHADGGTLFLDEVGELALELQPRLLRLLESSSVKRVGDTSYRRFDVRVIAATNRDLSAEVQARRFRPDLFHRLAVAEVRIPPLRERQADIPLLVDGILADLAAAGAPRASVPPETLAALAAYPWPGNVRQLRNVLERALAVDPSGGEIARDALGLAPPPAGAEVEDASAPHVDPAVPFHEAKDRLIHRWERSYLSGLLERAGGNIAQAARTAGVDRAHLYRLLRKHGLHR
jgi:DNA-binding NtrC family response regulator